MKAEYFDFDRSDMEAIIKLKGEFAISYEDKSAFDKALTDLIDSYRV